MQASPSIHVADLDIRLIDDPMALEADWRDLEMREWASLNQTFFWCDAWAKAQGSPLSAIAGYRHDRALFILPLDIASGWMRRIARMPGGPFNNLNTGLFAEALAPLGDADIAHLKTRMAELLRRQADLFVMDKAPLDWKGVRHPLAALASIESHNHAFQLPLGESMEATIAQLHAKTRRKRFRSQQRKLEALGGFEHVVATTTGQQHDLLDRFFAQKGARLTEFGLPDVFQPAQVRAFFHKLIDAPGHSGNRPLYLQAIRLKGAHEGHVAAIAGFSRKGGHVLCQFSSIDDSIAGEASPGELLFWLAIEKSIADGASLFDFGIGDQPYKRGWCSVETVHHDIVLPLSPLGRLLAPTLLAATRAKAAIKRRPRLYALAQRWRAGHNRSGNKA